MKNKLKSSSYRKMVVGLITILACLVVFFSIKAINSQADGPEIYDMGRLIIVSDGSGDNWGTHSFLLYTNTSNKKQTVAETTVKPNQTISIGTYGNKPDGKGIYVNLEAYFTTVDENAYKNRVSIASTINNLQFTLMNKSINSRNTWTATKNCAWFAVNVWNDSVLSKYDLDAGLISNPKTLSKAIKKRKSSIKDVSMPIVKCAYRLYGTYTEKCSSSTYKSKDYSSK